tara:strand:+ start:1261 stop:1734 length:474 start_codon:yes stop_codon:yes gene_type:complete
MATLTSNPNFLSPVGFQFKIDTQEFPNLEYFATACTMPGFNLTSVDTPFRGVNLAMTGDRLTFDELALRVNVTENLENYVETFNWMHRLINSNQKEENLKYDATLLILSSHNNVSKEIKFNGVFPTALSAIEFDTQAETVDYVQADITFGFTNFEIN